MNNLIPFTLDNFNRCFCNLEEGRDCDIFRYEVAIVGCLTAMVPIIATLAFKHLHKPQPKPSPYDPKPLSQPFDTCCSELCDSYEKIAGKIRTVLPDMKSANVWHDEEFKEKMHVIMKKAFKNMQLYFKELNRICEGDAQEMTKMIARQCNKNGDPLFCRFFFNNSLPQMYHLARKCAYFENETNPLTGEERLRCWRSIPLTREQEAPYFTAGTKEYKWRSWFNKLCDMIDQNGLRQSLQKRDDRFTRWAERDVAYIGHTLNDHNPSPYPTTAPSAC